MDVDSKIEIMKRVGEEVLTIKELHELFETKNHPMAYDGFEPSGFGHLPLIFRAINLNDLFKAGVKFTLFLADWHAWLNNKMGGDLDRIKTVGKYFIEIWKAAGVDVSKINLIWASEILDKDYLETVLKVTKATTIARMMRCTTIMGRAKGEAQRMGQLMYPAMQVSDIFKLKVDICQLGLDQRRANILAREIGEQIGFWKPVAVHHHMLPSLKGPVSAGSGVFDEDSKLNQVIAMKMSKSKPETCIYVHDDEKIIEKKIMNAYCPEKKVEGNAILDYTKHIVMRKVKNLLVERPSKFGGNVNFSSYDALERSFVNGGLHPLDLKKAVAREINLLVKPVRDHFIKNKSAAKLYSVVKEQKITR